MPATTKKRAKPKAKAKSARQPKASASKTVLVLRTSDKDGKSNDGAFQWPESGEVVAPDWQPTKECGNGLHGWLWGAGDWTLKSGCVSPWWYVVEVAESEIVDLGDKVKFPRCKIVSRFKHWREAMAVIRERLKSDAQGVLLSVATKDRELASATGYFGHASATGYCGHASATGDSGHASATGNCGHASATGYCGHASATGNCGWSVAGYNGKAKADKNGVLTLLYWDDSAKRPRVVVGYVGEDGIKPDTWYSVVDGKLAQVA